MLERRDVTSTCGESSQLQERIALCRNTRRSNCIGTALYLAGEAERDEFVDLHLAHADHLAGLERLDIPAKGVLVAWHLEVRITPFFKEIGFHNFFGGSEADYERFKGADGSFFTFTAHMGIVASAAPLRITHRLERKGVFVEGHGFRTADRHVRTDPHGQYFEIAYYLPRDPA